MREECRESRDAGIDWCRRRIISSTALHLILAADAAFGPCLDLESPFRNFLPTIDTEAELVLREPLESTLNHGDPLMLGFDLDNQFPAFEKAPGMISRIASNLEGNERGTQTCQILVRGSVGTVEGRNQLIYRRVVHLF